MNFNRLTRCDEDGVPTLAQHISWSPLQSGFIVHTWDNRVAYFPYYEVLTQGHPYHRMTTRMWGEVTLSIERILQRRCYYKVQVDRLQWPKPVLV